MGGGAERTEQATKITWCQETSRFNEWPFTEELFSPGLRSAVPRNPAVCQGTERMSTPARIYMPLQRKNPDTELYTRRAHVLD